MSDTVTIHNGHCSYHGPADKAPAWAARAASADHKISPAPTRSPMNSIAPVPTQTVSADAIPAPLTSFEDTTHAWEEGYRAGCAAAKVKPPIEADGYNIEEMLANLGAHPEWPAMRKAGDVKLYFLNEGDAHKIRFAALEGLA